VDLDNGTLAIRETRVSVDGRPQPSTPKTDRSARELPMPASLVAALRKAKTIQNRERLALGSAYLDGGYVVVDEAGRPYLPDRLSRAWPKCADALKSR
jgi:integrase